MNILDARRVVFDFSSHDPKLIRRIADALMREQLVINEEAMVGSLDSTVIYRGHAPTWGTISYKLDPGPDPAAPTFKPGAFAKVKAGCSLPLAIGRRVRLLRVTKGYEERPDELRHWDVVVDDVDSVLHGNPYGLYEASMELLP